MVINIDLDSWEVGYADGQFCRLSQCPANLDSFSYSSGSVRGVHVMWEPTGINLRAGARPTLYERDGPTTGPDGFQSLPACAGGALKAAS
jgi:hypothetical protein